MRNVFLTHAAPLSGAAWVLPGERTSPIVRGEDRDDYEALRRRVAALVRPADVIEQMFVGDIVDLVWEAARLRRIRAAQLDSKRHQGLMDVLMPHVGALGVRNLSEGWARREPKAMQQVDELLAKAELTMEHVAARTFMLQMGDMERLDRLIAATEARRSAALREIERHRATLARALRSAAEAEDVLVEEPGAAHEDSGVASGDSGFDDPTFDDDPLPDAFGAYAAHAVPGGPEDLS